MRRGKGVAAGGRSGAGRRTKAGGGVAVGLRWGPAAGPGSRCGSAPGVAPTLSPRPGMELRPVTEDCCRAGSGAALGMGPGVGPGDRDAAGGETEAELVAGRDWMVLPPHPHLGWPRPHHTPSDDPPHPLSGGASHTLMTSDLKS